MIQSPATKVLGYIKPDSCFYTLEEWELLTNRMIELQAIGLDTRSGEISCKNPSFCGIADFDEFVSLIVKHFNFQLEVETSRYNLLTQKNVLDFIEDFVNHRFWGFEREFSHYFPDITKLRFAYFYSRGDLEPYVLLDEEYTTQMYGSLNNTKELSHYTSPTGLVKLQEAIQTGNTFDISTFTVAARPFFRESSTLLVTLKANVKAGFRSDIKSVATNTGRRACNMHRLEYPGKDQTNICYELDSCDGDVRTSLWNEYIAEPIVITAVDDISS
jgi:hypothetical protein